MNRHPALISFFLLSSGIFLEAVFVDLQGRISFFFLPFLALLIAAFFILKKLNQKTTPLFFLLAGMLIFQIHILESREAINSLSAASGKEVFGEGLLLKKLNSRKNNMAIIQLTSLNNKNLSSKKACKVLTFFPSNTLQKIEKNTPFLFEARIEPLKKEDNNYLSSLSKNISGFAFIRRKSDIRFFPYKIKKNVFTQFKTFMQNHLEQALSMGFTSEKAKNVYLALILGKREGLSFKMQEQFKKTGTFHIFSISGLHFATVVFSFLIILIILRIGGRKRLLLLTMFALFYLFLTGIRVSSLRAFLMMVIAFQSRIIYREYNVLNALGATGLLILLFNPFSLFTPGFQLSFMAVMGIVILPKWTLEILRNHAKMKTALEKDKTIWDIPIFQKTYLSFTACFAAWFFTAPVLTYHFGAFSLFSSLFNVLIVPVASIVIQIGVFSSFLSMGFSFFSMILNMIAEKLILLILLLIDLSEEFFSLMIQGDRVSAHFLLAVIGILIFLHVRKEEIF